MITDVKKGEDGARQPRTRKPRRCYRCGAILCRGADICPACGFSVHSPVRIDMAEAMEGPYITDEKGKLLWKGTGKDTAFLYAPTRRTILVCWRSCSRWEDSPLHQERMTVVNGEAYRFERTYRFGFIRWIKTRRIQKRR